MTLTVGHRHNLLRFVAGALLTLCLLGCFALHWFRSTEPAMPTFLLVVAECCALVALTRGLGTRLGLALGLAAGLSVTIGLLQQFSGPLPNQIAFVIVAPAVHAVLGFMAGSWDLEDVEGVKGMPGEGQWIRTPATPRTRHAHLSIELESVLGDIVNDFYNHLDEGGAALPVAAADVWSDFDQFVRQVLRERIGATGVRVFGVSPNGQQLEPLTRNPGPPTSWPSAREGVLGHAVSTGQVYVSDDPQGKALAARLAQQAGRGEPGYPRTGTIARATSPETRATGVSPVDAARWAWLLPIHPDGQTRAIVVVSQITRPAFARADVARAVRALLQLLWSHVNVLSLVGHVRATDQQSGILNRAELLAQLEGITQQSGREGEPIMVLTLAIEGLRWLDDTGQWSQRDALIAKLGRCLQVRTRTDDVVGRFSDDRFVVVLRRLDANLGTLITEKLMDCLRTEVLSDFNGTPLDPGIPGNLLNGTQGGPQLRLRAGLAGSGMGTRGARVRIFPTFDDAEGRDNAPHGEGTDGIFDGLTLLERALGLLEYARSQRIDVATDRMEGLPPELRRGYIPPAGSPAEQMPLLHATEEGDPS